MNSRLAHFRMLGMILFLLVRMEPISTTLQVIGLYLQFESSKKLSTEVVI